MKIGIRTASLGSIGSELPAALEAAARLGYDGLEVVTRDAAQLRGWLQMDGSEGAGTVRELARRHGCAITSFSLALFRPVSFAQEDESLRQQGIQLLSDTLRACANVGGETVLLPFFDRKRLDEIGAEELARFVDGLRRCARVAEDTAMRIALETSFSPALLQRILGAVGSERVGVYQDLANAITFGQDPAVALRALGPAVAMVHVKDTKAGGGDAMLGEGLVDWPECRAAIRDIGYDGWFVLETPPGDDPLATGARHLEFTRRWLAG